MLIEAPSGNIFERAGDHQSIDWIDLTSAECSTRAMRKCTRGGREIRILLNLGTVLRHGDVLIDRTDSAPMVAVNVIPDEVIVASVRDAAEIAALAYKLGDAHVPMQFCDGAIITAADPLVQAEVDAMGIEYTIEQRRFSPSFRSASQIVFSDTFEITRTR
jgi:urease accessory protein UreE